MAHNLENFNGNKPNREGEVTVSSITELDDTSISNPQINDVLKWNGTNWVNVSPNTVSSQYIYIGDRNASINYSTCHGASITSTHVFKIYSENPVNTITNASFVYQGDDSADGNGFTINASALKNGVKYKIKTQGDVNWTSIGAANSNVGTVFTYNGSTVTGSGTASSFWIRGVVLPAGTYYAQARVKLTDSTDNAYCSYRLLTCSATSSKDNVPLSAVAEFGKKFYTGGAGNLLSYFTLTESTEIQIVGAGNMYSINSSVSNHGNELSRYGYMFIRKI